MTTSILLVDDHPVFLRGLRSLLDDENDIHVVGEAANGIQALEMIEEFSPQVVVMDITMPGLNGIEATRKILTSFPKTKVIALSIHSEKAFVEDMLKAGAVGYIVKESVPEELVKGIQCVISGASYLSPVITGLVLSGFRKSVSDAQTADLQAIEIIETKLNPFDLPENHVCRPRLTQMLEKNRSLPLQTITAPAGYGKSVLAGCWTGQTDWTCSWISLGPEENGLIQFLRYMVHAVKKLFPDAMADMEGSLGSGDHPPIQVLAGKMINDINLIALDFILVLDNFHHIRNKGVNDFLSELLRHPPKALHLVLIGRSSPFLPLSRLRARTQLGEIRMNDLKFNLEESESFLKQATKEKMSSTWFTGVVRKTEGWITGLRLFSLACDPGANSKELMSQLEQTPDYVMEYLFHEVFAACSDQMKQGLLLTSLVNRFSREVCDALFRKALGKPGETSLDAQVFIEEVKRENLFVVTVEKESKWYRFHHQFGQLLQKQLNREKSREEIFELHSRVFKWFQDNGYTDQAIHHSVAAGNCDAAVDLIEENRETVMNSDQFFRLGTWINELPDSEKKNRIGIVLAQAWVWLMQGNIKEIPRVIQQAQSLAGQMNNASKDNESMDNDQNCRAEIDFFHGVIAQDQGNWDQSLDCFARAEKRLTGTPFPALISEIEYRRCMALYHRGEKDIAIARLGAGLEKTENTIIESRLIFTRCLIHIQEGQTASGIKESQRLLERCQENNLVYMKAWAIYLKGYLAFQTLDLQTAYHSFIQAVEIKETADTRVHIDAVAGLALTCHFLGRHAQADELIAKGLARAQINEAPLYLEILSGCKARIASLRGKITEASLWPGAVNETSAGPSMFCFLEIPVITECRLLVTGKTKACLSDALARTAALLEQFQAKGSYCQLLDILVLEAVARYMTGDAALAQESLGKALQAAEPSGWIRPFVEQEPVVLEIMGQMKTSWKSTDIVGMILAALREKDAGGSGDIESEPEEPLSVAKASQPLIDPITNREMEILCLLAKHLYNKEIAEQLFISPETVKTHLKRIYEKLMVSNRRQAVARAYELGLLKDHESL